MADKTEEAGKGKADAKAGTPAATGGGYNQKKFRKGQQDRGDDPFRRQSDRPEKRAELKSAEEKYNSLIDKRNEMNQLAKEARDDRDMLQQKRKEIMASRRELEDKRDELTLKMREHKKKRNEFQARAKALIALKKDARKSLDNSLTHDISTLESELRIAKMKQETVPMDIQKENDLVDEIRDKTKEIDRLRKVIEEQAAIATDVEHIDANIDELFKLADEEHKHVVELGDQAHALHEQVVAIIKDASLLIVSANKKHEEFLEMRRQADDYHQKAIELKDKILSIKGDERRERYEARAEIDEQNKKARELTDKGKLDEAADKALDELLKKGKFGFMG